MQVELTPALTKRPAAWKTALNLTLPIILIAIFAWQIHKSWPDIQKYDWSSARWEFAALALLLLLINSFLEIVIWNRTLGWLTDALPFKFAAPVYIWSSLARYIPGKVASLILRAGLAKEVDRDVVPALASSTVELALRIASASVFFVIAIVGLGLNAGKSQAIAQNVAFTIIPLVLICAHPKIMLPVMNWGLRKIKQPTIERSLKYRDVLLVFVVTLFRWIVYGMAFAMLAWAVFPDAIRHVPVLVGTASGSWGIGFILMSPGGIGAAELLQQALLTKLLFPKALVAVVPVLFRMGSLMAEGLWALISVWLWRKR